MYITANYASSFSKFKAEWYIAAYKCNASFSHILLKESSAFFKNQYHILTFSYILKLNSSLTTLQHSPATWNTGNSYNLNDKSIKVILN